MTEGEIDCLSMSQLQGNSWPVVSIACGAGPQIKKYIAQHRDYLNGFDEVVLMFDADEPGRKAALEAAAVIGAKARIAELPYPFKDANEMLVAGEGKALINAMWKALPYRPEGVVEMSTLLEKVKEQQPHGLSTPFPNLDKVTYGTRRGEILALGAGTGIGKTTFLLQWLHHLARVHGQNVAGFFLESAVTDTARRLAGIEAEKTLHIPDTGWTDTDIDAAFSRLKQGGKVFLYDSFGNNTWEAIREKIEYLANAEDVHYLVLDHLTALATWQDDERKAIDLIMSEMGGMVKKLDLTILLVSHLATPDGTPHEEGGRVLIKQFRGSRSIGYWSHGMFGLERNQQASDPIERSTTTLRCLKDRFTGRSTGETFSLFYNQATGLLTEDFGVATASSVFRDETKVAGEGGF